MNGYLGEGRRRERERERARMHEETFLPSPALLSDPNRHMEHFYKFIEFSVPLGACLDVDGGTALKTTKCPQSIHGISPIQASRCLDWTTPTQTHRWLFLHGFVSFKAHILALLISFKGGSLDETDVGMRLLRSESYTHTNWALSLIPRKCF